MGMHKHKQKNIKILKTDEEIKLVLDPYRKTIIKQYLKNKDPQTVKQVADALEEVPAKVHYHVKKLLDKGYLKLEKTEEINGILAKYYKSVYDNFMIEGSDLSQEVYLSYQPQWEKSFDWIANHLKDDLRKHMDLVRGSEGKVQRHIVADHQELYMTPEEQEQFLQEFDELLAKYGEPGDNKEEYSMVRTMVRVK